MIFYYLVCWARVVRSWFVMPTSSAVARIRINAPCPACGVRSNRVRCVERLTGQGNNGVGVVSIFVEHTCAECGARWFEQPVRKVSPSFVWPAVPRNELEKLEDEQLKLHPWGGAERPAASEKVN